MAQRRAVLFQASCTGTCNWRYRAGCQPDGKHGRQRHLRRDFIHRCVYRGTYTEPGDQPAGRVCSHKPSAVCRIFGKFYEGGGRMFNPFKENTKYADIKED